MTLHRQPRDAHLPVPCSHPFRLLLTLADAAALTLSFGIAVASAGAYRTASDSIAFGHPGTLALHIAFVAVILVVFRSQGMYRYLTHPSVIDHVPGLVRALVIGSIALVAANAFIVPEMMTSAVLIRAGIAAAILVPLCRFPVYRWEIRRRNSGSVRNVVMLGSGTVATELAAKLDEKADYGMNVVAFVDHHEPADHKKSSVRVAKTEELLEIFGALEVDQIVVAFSRSTDGEFLDLLRICSWSLEVSVVPRMFDITTSATRFDQVSRFPFLTVEKSPCSGVGAMLKRTFDTAASAAALLVLLPLLVAIAAMIKRDSHGPVFYHQQRIGKNGKPFKMVKFRTMADGADRLLPGLRDASDFDEVLFKMKEDPRITRVGKRLRHHSLDELPQLINVLRGEMSLIGPRPPLATEVEDYPFWFHRRLEVRPGITGLWQIGGRSDLDFAESTRLDLYYVEHWSLWLDIMIILRTVGVILTGRGAY